MPKESKDHEHPVSPVDLRDRVTRARPGDIAVVKGQYSPDPSQANRCFVFIMDETGLVPLFDCWILEKDFEEALDLIRAERTLFIGACDAMYATKPKYVWVEREETLLLFHKNRLLAGFGADGVRLFVSSPAKMIETVEINDIYLYLSDTWVECGVRLRLKTGKSIDIAKNKEWSAVFDPTYDAIQMMVDTFWAIDLGRAIQKHLDVPLNMHKDLE